MRPSKRTLAANLNLTTLLLIVSFAFSLRAFAAEPTKSEEEIAFEAELKDIANSVNALKEKVYKSKAKLKLLEETILLGKMSGSTAIIRFKDKTKGFFKIVAGECYLNGRLVSKLNPKQNLSKWKVIFDGETPPGNNQLSVKLTFTGAESGVLKLFSYFKDYQFNLESNYEFPVSYGQTTAVNIESVDLGPFKHKIEDRLKVHYNVITEEQSSIPF